MIQVHFVFPDALNSRDNLDLLVERVTQSSSPQAIAVSFIGSILRPFLESGFDQLATFSQLLLEYLSSMAISIPTDTISSTFQQNVGDVEKIAVGYRITSELTERMKSKALLLLNQVSIDLFRLIWEQITNEQMQTMDISEISGNNLSSPFLVTPSQKSISHISSISDYLKYILNSILKTDVTCELIIWKQLNQGMLTVLASPIGKVLTYQEAISFLRLLSEDDILHHVIIAAETFQIPVELRIVGQELDGSIKINALGVLDKGIKFSVGLPATLSTHEIRDKLTSEKSMDANFYSFQIHNRIICASANDNFETPASPYAKLLQTTVAGDQSLLSDILELNSSRIEYWDIDELTLTTVAEKPLQFPHTNNLPLLTQADVDILFQSNTGLLVMSSQYILVPYVFHSGKLLCFPPIIFFNRWKEALKDSFLFVVSDGTHLLKINCRAVLLEENLDTGWKMYFTKAGLAVNFRHRIPDALSYYWKRATLQLMLDHLE